MKESRGRGSLSLIYLGLDIMYRLVLAVICVFLLGGCASRPVRDTEPVAIRQGQTKAVGADGLQVTLQWISERSGCNQDCSEMSFTGAVNAKRDSESHIIEGNDSRFTRDTPGWLQLYGYWFDMVEIRRDKKNRLEAVFVVPHHGLSYPAYNLQAGNAYQAANKMKPGTTTTDSGLQYEVVTLGTGKKPAKDDMVEISTKCEHVDRTPCSGWPHVQHTIAVDDLLKGLKEGVQLMPEGSTYQFIVPTTLAYGDYRQQEIGVGRNETLILNIELQHVLAKQ